jgi:hypothetical protein
MIKRIHKRIHKRILNRRPKSEDPVAFVDWGMGCVPTGGFAWVEGRTGPSATHSRFLIPQSTAFASQETPTDLYLQFARLEPTPEAALEFANRYGRLGLVERHFHSPHTEVQFAECWSDWLAEIKQFRTCLEGWFLAAEDDRGALVSFLRDHDWRILVASDGPWLTAQLKILSQINEKLNPMRVLPEACFLKRCNRDRLPKVTPFVTYHVNHATRLGQPTGRHDDIIARVMPTALLTAIWLQFAEWVTGSRVVRKCEKCQQWMDITESPRKGAKRMHARCSLALRMARYRRKKKNKL